MERQLFPLLLERGEPLYARAFSGYWLDMGTLEKYQQVQDDIRNGRVKFLGNAVREPVQ